jgi:hypothetical protein
MKQTDKKDVYMKIKTVKLEKILSKHNIEKSGYIDI